jgi:hypothetical protein
MEKPFLGIEEFELVKPDNYAEILQAADSLFAELLIKYHYIQNKHLTLVNDNCIIKMPSERKENE